MTVLEGQPQPVQRMSLGASWRRAWRTGDWWRHLGLGAFLFFMFLPFIITIIISFKDIPQFDHYPFTITYPLHPDNYLEAWRIVSRYILNSIITSSTSVVGMVILAAIAAWAFARYPFPGRDFFFFGVLALLMVPGELTLIPAFLLVKDLGLLNTRLGSDRPLHCRRAGFRHLHPAPVLRSSAKRDVRSGENRRRKRIAGIPSHWHPAVAVDSWCRRNYARSEHMERRYLAPGYTPQ